MEFKLPWIFTGTPINNFLKLFIYFLLWNVLALMVLKASSVFVPLLPRKFENRHRTRGSESNVKIADAVESVQIQQTTLLQTTGQWMNDPHLARCFGKKQNFFVRNQCLAKNLNGKKQINKEKSCNAFFSYFSSRISARNKYFKDKTFAKSCLSIGSNFTHQSSC